MPNFKKISKIKNFIFDLDGVLLDSKKNMKISWGAVQKKFLIKRSFNHYKKFIGLPFRKILKNLKINSKIKEIEITYRKNSLKNFNKLRLYPGTKKTLRILTKNNKKICLFTSKEFLRTKNILKKFNLKFKTIHCPNKILKGKPYPDHILNCLKINEFKKKETVYVGDTYFDYLAAKRSGIGFIFASYGFGENNKIYKNKINDIKYILKY